MNCMVCGSEMEQQLRGCGLGRHIRIYPPNYKIKQRIYFCLNCDFMKIVTVTYCRRL